MLPPGRAKLSTKPAPTGSAWRCGEEGRQEDHPIHISYIRANDLFYKSDGTRRVAHAHHYPSLCDRFRRPCNLGLGIGSLAILVSERAVPLRHYAAAIGLISGGLGLGGLAQALRLLAEILTRGAWFI